MPAVHKFETVIIKNLNIRQKDKHMLHRSNAVPKKSYAFVFFFGVVPSRKLFFSELCLLGKNFGVMPFGVVTTLVFRSYASPPRRRPTDCAGG